MKPRDRRYAILRDLVELYTKIRKPISSSELVKEYGYRWCPATVRNDLAALEREGYIYKPFPSSGRVPTAKGFRFYARWIINSLRSHGEAAERALEGLEKAFEGIASLLAHPTTFDIWKEAATFIASLSSQIGFIISPDIGSLRIARAVLIRTGEKEISLHLLTEGELSERFPIHLPQRVNEAELKEAEEALEEILKGRALKDAGTIVEELGPRARKFSWIVEEILRALGRENRKVYLSGLEYLSEAIRAGCDIKPLFRVIGNERLFMELVLESRPDREGIEVRVGDFPVKGLEEFALVSADFYHGQGVLGTFGPMWLDYSKAISAVELIARALSAYTAAAPASVTSGSEGRAQPQ